MFLCGFNICYLGIIFYIFLWNIKSFETFKGNATPEIWSQTFVIVVSQYVYKYTLFSLHWCGHEPCFVCNIIIFIVSSTFKAYQKIFIFSTTLCYFVSSASSLFFLNLCLYIVVIVICLDFKLILHSDVAFCFSAHLNWQQFRWDTITAHHHICQFT